jgi:hypothetical protein
MSASRPYGGGLLAVGASIGSMGAGSEKRHASGMGMGRTHHSRVGAE